jgi:glycosyltransferase involved in cell wall biosynthesis
MKTVLFVSHTAELNGAELWLLETLKGLDRAKLTPVLALPGPGLFEPAARALGIETVRVPSVWWITPRSGLWKGPAAGFLTRRHARRLAVLAREKGAALVFSNSAAVAAGALAARRARLPHVWAIHEMLSGPLAHLFYWRGPARLARFIEDHSDRVIVNSRATAAAFTPSGKIVLVPNGVRRKPYPAERVAEVRRELGFPDGAPVIGVVGKIYKGKGQALVVQAAALLLPEFPDLHVLVVGEMGDKRYGAHVKRLARETGLAGRVRFAGYRHDLNGVLKCMSVLAVASTVESFGRTAIDAMAAGVPVAAAAAGGLTEIIEDGRNGLLVAGTGAEVLAAALRRILADPALARTLVDNGRRTVDERFSLEAQIRGVESVLDAYGGAG